MEKNLNMSNVDELCVKYVFDELDPSEITLVEHAMLRDQNLLIEVESLKSTWRKLKKMPEMDPPSNLSRAIMEQAQEHSNQQQMFGKGWKNPGLMATAAVVLFSLLISTAYLLPDDQVVNPGNMQVETASPEATDRPEHSSHNEQRGSFSSPSWGSLENMIFIGSANNDSDSISPDSLGTQSTGFQNRAGDQRIMTPTIRNFQLTGTDF